MPCIHTKRILGKETTTHARYKGCEIGCRNSAAEQTFICFQLVIGTFQIFFSTTKHQCETQEDYSKLFPFSCSIYQLRANEGENDRENEQLQAIHQKSPCFCAHGHSKTEHLHFEWRHSRKSVQTATNVAYNSCLAILVCSRKHQKSRYSIKGVGVVVRHFRKE